MGGWSLPRASVPRAFLAGDNSPFTAKDKLQGDAHNGAPVPRMGVAGKPIAFLHDRFDGHECDGGNSTLAPNSKMNMLKKL
jgi:hypothetical protein